MDMIIDERKGGKSFRAISKILESNFTVSWSHTTIQRKLKEWNKNSNISGEEVDTTPDAPIQEQETRELIT